MVADHLRTSEYPISGGLSSKEKITSAIQVGCLRVPRMDNGHRHRSLEHRPRSVICLSNFQDHLLNMAFGQKSKYRSYFSRLPYASRGAVTTLGAI